LSTLINRTIHGLSWNFKSQIFTQVINFLVAFLLMRWLVPEDFGKFTMVFVIVVFLQIFRDAGLTVAIIQKKNLSDIDISTSFWTQLFISIIIAVPLFFTGSYFNEFYNETVLDQILFWLSIDFMLGTIGITPMALLKKELEFKTMFKIQFLAVLISSLCSIGMALEGFGYMSLVGKFISYTLIVSIGAFLMVDWKPKFIFSKSILRQLFKIGLPDTGNHLLSYLVRNTDDFFIGKVIGGTSLGYYNRAYTIMLLPIVNITSVVQNVLFSTWSKMQNDMEGIKKMYLRVSSVIALIVFPFMILLAVLTEPIVFLIFGEQWLPIVDTLRILSIIGMFQSVSSLIGIIFIVFKQNNLAFRITLITSILTIIIIIWFVYIFKSIELTSLVYGISNLLFLYPMYYYAARIMNISVVRLLYPLIYPLIFSLLIGLFGRILFYALPFDHIFLKLLISLPSALCLYIGLCVCFKNQTFYDLLKVLDYLRSTK
jgi:O-antigen/teichoic acid export membrane protein